MHIDIGLNTCCFTRRWEYPENWARLVHEAGFSYFQLDSDMLDPFFSGNEAYQLETARRLRLVSEKYGLTSTAYYTGMASYRFHGIAHSDASARTRMQQWIEKAMDIALAAGMKKVGGRFDAYSVETLSDQRLFMEQLEESMRIYRHLAEVGRAKGLEEIELEQMYVPSLYPYTIQQTEAYLCRLNENNSGCRLSTTVDVGHMASERYGGTDENLSYIEWLKHFAPVSEDIHIQQTDRRRSEHNPFTAECNAKGDIRIDEMLEAIRYAHEHYSGQRLAQYLPGVERNILILEYIPSTVETEQEVLDKLGESVLYLRRYVPVGGLEI